MNLKSRKNRITISCLALFTASAQAQVINFDEIATPGGDTAFAYLAPGYDGFNWSGGYGSDSWVISPESSQWGFTGTKAHSENNFAWNNGGVDLFLAATSGSSFDLYGFWARGSGLSVDPQSMTVHGFVGISEVFTDTLNLNTAYQQYTLNMTGITSVTISNGGSSVLIDDINVSSVPEPETYALLLGGLGLMGFGVRRRVA